MQPRIQSIPKKILVGYTLEMSLIQNKTFQLFSTFMPNRKQISNKISEDIFEVMVYDNLYFRNFNPNTTFKKWATLEVSDVTTVPNNMSLFALEEGLYAIFRYKGLPQDFGKFMNAILTQWLPQSNYQLDDRPHFNILGKHYKNNHPESEEDVYIPVKEN